MSALIVGAGIGGLATALKLAPMPVTVLSAAPLGDGAASAWAQGGVAAAIDPGDSPAEHARDTVAVAGGLADPEVVAKVTEAAPDCIAELMAIGVRFDQERGGALRLGREGGHHKHRIVHAHGDSTGSEIMRALLKAARATPSITLLDGVEAEALLTADGSVCGVLARCGAAPFALRARAVVLATGGAGGLFLHTSNPVGARGRGVALAARAGAILTDLEFVQFHPTALAAGRDPMPLVTEALRGEGALLVDDRSGRFMPAVHPLAELAPRDVVAREVWRRCRAGRRVFLDARRAVGAAFPQRFPTVTAACRAAGIDPVVSPIPIAPAAHYHMGGVQVDPRGRTSLPGLWAVGEVAATGLHGANRLASNSLLEALAFAGFIADDIQGLDGGRPSTPELAAPPPWRPAAADRPVIAELRALMSAAVGVERNEVDLRRACGHLRAMRTAAEPVSRRLADAALVAQLIAAQALARRESRGGHYRADHSVAVPALTHRRATTLAMLDAAELQEAMP